MGDWRKTRYRARQRIHDQHVLPVGRSGWRHLGASLMAFDANDSGTWKSPGSWWVNDGGTWKAVQAWWVNDAGTWKKAWPTVSHFTITNFSSGGDVDTYMNTGGGFNYGTVWRPDNQGEYATSKAANFTGSEGFQAYLRWNNLHYPNTSSANTYTWIFSMVNSGTSIHSWGYPTNRAFVWVQQDADSFSDDRLVVEQYDASTSFVAGNNYSLGTSSVDSNDELEFGIRMPQTTGAAQFRIRFRSFSGASWTTIQNWTNLDSALTNDWRASDKLMHVGNAKSSFFSYDDMYYLSVAAY